MTQGNSQEVVGLGWLGWAAEGGTTGPYGMDFFTDIGGVQQIACSERCCLILSKAGKVYMLYYTSLSPVSILSTIVSCVLHLILKKQDLIFWFYKLFSDPSAVEWLWGSRGHQNCDSPGRETLHGTDQ